MSVRSFKTSSIRTGEKRSKFWDQSTVILTPAFESIASTTLGSDTATITFSSIPATYQHLQIRFFGNTDHTSANDGVNMRLNSDTGSNYAWHLLNGGGTSAFASGNASQTSIRAAGTLASGSTAIGAAIVDIHDYANTSKNTTTRSFYGYDSNGASTQQVGFFSGLWINTSAVSTILLFPNGGSNFKSGTTVALYGIKSL